MQNAHNVVAQILREKLHYEILCVGQVVITASPPFRRIDAIISNTYIGMNVEKEFSMFPLYFNSLVLLCLSCQQRSTKNYRWLKEKMHIGIYARILVVWFRIDQIHPICHSTIKLYSIESFSPFVRSMVLTDSACD